jgi:hypothetical protein
MNRNNQKNDGAELATADSSAKVNGFRLEVLSVQFLAECRSRLRLGFMTSNEIYF